MTMTNCFERIIYALFAYLTPKIYTNEHNLHLLKFLNTPINSALPRMFFIELSSKDSSWWIWRWSVKRNRCYASYKNLFFACTHYSPQLPRWRGFRNENVTTTAETFYGNFTSSAYYIWYDIVANILLPFQSAECSVLRRHVKHQHILSSTFSYSLLSLFEVGLMHDCFFTPRNICSRILWMDCEWNPFP